MIPIILFSFSTFFNSTDTKNTEEEDKDRWFPIRYALGYDNGTFLPHFKINHQKYGSVFWKKYSRAMQRTNRIDIKMIKELCNRNYPPAIHTMGELYETGYKMGKNQTIERNLTTALQYFKKGAKLGYPESYSSLGFYFRHGFGMKNSDQMISEIYNELGSSKNSIRALLTNAASYTFGVSLPYSLTKASLILLKTSSSFCKAADSGTIEETTLQRLSNDLELRSVTEEEINNKKIRNYLKYMATSSAQHEISYGMIKYLGKYGEKVDFNAAREIFEKHQDNGEALGLLGRMHHLGHGVEKDIDKAEMYYQRGAEKEDPTSLTGIGVIKLNEGDVYEASKYFLNASQRGAKGAEFNYASLLLNGDPQLNGTIKDAIEILKRLDNEQLSIATHTLAYLSLVGKPKHSEKKGVKLFWRIMRKGSWNNIGKQAEKEFINKDYEQALFHWMELGDMGIERAAYNAGQMLINWKHFFKVPPLGMKETQLYDTAKRYMKLSRKLGYVDSSIYVSRLYFQNGEEDKGIKWLSDGSAISPNVSIEVAKVILEGIHIPRNYTKLQKYINKSNNTALLVSMLPEVTKTVFFDIVKAIHEIIEKVDPERAKGKLLEIFCFINSYINKEKLLIHVTLLILIILIRQRIAVFYK